jgi:predicted Ser/Thr protein kinase
MDRFLAQGKRGEVFLRIQHGKKVLVKRRNPASAVDTIANEARYTRLLNKVAIGPRFIDFDASTGELVREYIDGAEFRKWLPAAPGPATRRVLLSVLDQCKAMDDLGVEKQEMMRPWKHILVTKAGKAVLIDFERCRETASPKNVTQFCQFLTGTRVRSVFTEKGLLIDKQKILELAKNYKRSMINSNKRLNSQIFNQIRKQLVHA